MKKRKRWWRTRAMTNHGRVFESNLYKAAYELCFTAVHLHVEASSVRPAFGGRLASRPRSAGMVSSQPCQLCVLINAAA